MVDRDPRAPVTQYYRPRTISCPSCGKDMLPKSLASKLNILKALTGFAVKVTNGEKCFECHEKAKNKIKLKDPLYPKVMGEEFDIEWPKKPGQCTRLLKFIGDVGFNKVTLSKDKITVYCKADGKVVETETVYV